MKQLIKNGTPRPLVKFLVKLGNFYGSSTMMKNAFPSQKGAFNVLRGLGWKPRLCIDVGAYHGQWATMFRSVFPESRVLMVEGQSEKESILKSKTVEDPLRLEYEIALLGATEGQQVTFVEMETGSSVFEESSPYPRKRKTVKLKTLDNVLRRHPDFEDANALKLDTQGYELEVMKGAGKLLKKVEVILLEVSLIQINKGAPLVAEVIAFLTERKFKLFDFCSQIRRKDGVLWH